MREIKFRAYLKESKQVVEVRHISFFKGETVVKVYDEPMDIEVWFDLEELEFLQYTGLKDKKGVEIYEGDIVLNLEHNQETKGVVVFVRGGFRVALNIKGFKFNLPFNSFEENEYSLQVLGNIYENPELLEREPQ